MEIDTDELKQYAPLIPYVQKHYNKLIQFKGKGKNVMFSNCIWHYEKTGSLAFFNNGTYKCFGCGEHGDIITLVQKIENIGFQEACKMIGDNVGYDVIMEEPNPVFESYKDELDNHTRRYWINLNNNGDALRYLICERGLTKEFIDKFRLGLTDSEEYRYRNDIGNISNRIVFPILEHKRKKPKCIGMAYRCLDDSKPKYINDPNQDGREGQNPDLAGVFIKGNILYGMHQAYNAIASTGYLILVEGYIDVISLHQSGIENVVASMGTSITENQVKEIAKVTKNVLLCLDGDKAGINAMMKNIQLFYQYDINIAVCIIDNGMDPADLCKSKDFDTVLIGNEIKKNTQQGIKFVINNVVEHYENIAIQERIKALKYGSTIIDAIQDANIRELYKSELYKRLDIN